MSATDTILSMIENQGPVVPMQVAKELKTDSILASAHLAELVSRKKVKISNIRVGSSPLYFIPGQEEKLVDFADNLNSKEKEAFLLLQEKKLLRDQQLEPAIRVALRAINDYAVSIQVRYNGLTELFWRWFMLEQPEAEKMISNTIEIKKKKEKAIEQKLIEKKKLEAIKEQEKEQKKLKLELEIKKETSKAQETSKTIIEYF